MPAAKPRPGMLPRVPALSFDHHRDHLHRVMQAVLRAADPAEALLRYWPQDEPVAASLRSAVLIAAGKASIGMARAAVERLNVRPNPGIVLAPVGVRAPPTLAAAGVRVFEVDHPLPAQRNLIAARNVGDATRLAASRRQPVVLLLSGGASAHLTIPDRGLTLSDVRSITDALLKSGAPIEELNAVRQCCETLKAGGLARMAAPAPVHAFILSDVLAGADSDPIGVIASGPTANVRRSPADALRVLEARGLADATPAITAHLRAQIKSRPVISDVSNATNVVVGSNVMAVMAARAELQSLGFTIAETRFSVTGDAPTRGRQLASLLARHAAHPQRPIAFVWGCETTVRVGGRATEDEQAFGGRNQEAALAAAVVMMELPDRVEVRNGHQDAHATQTRARGARVGCAILCLATDGVDGLTPPAKKPHAGAIVTGASVHVAARAGIPADAALAQHDSYRWTVAADAALITGPTGTNVNDVWIGLIY